jgi:hypothetical protein
MLTFLGIFLPIVFIVGLGAVLMTVPAYAEAYISGEVAGVLSKGAVYHTRGPIIAVTFIFSHKYLNHGGVVAILF